MATLFGNPVRRLLFRIEDAERFKRVELSWILSLATGIAFLAVILLWLGLYPGLVVPDLAWGLLVVAIAANAILYRTRLIGWRFRLEMIRKNLSAFGGRWFVVGFLAILAVQMSPLVGLWVTPGDDAKLYSLISVRMVESQGIPRDWGAFASQSWYTEYTHLLLPGFSSEVVFLDFLFAGAIPSTVSVIATVFRSLTAATLYVLVWTFTRRKMPAVLAMAIYGLVIVEPTFGWFTWGGMAELAAISLLPIAATGTYLVSINVHVSWRPILWTALLIAGMSLLHPFSFFYYLAFLIALSFTSFFKRRISRGLRAWLPTILGLAIGSGPILNAFAQEMAVSQSYSLANPAWTPTLSLSMSIPVALYSLVSRFTTVYGFAVSTALVLGLGGLVVARGFFRAEKRVLEVLSVWYLLMFLLHENNPNGLLVIPFPLWYRIDSNRTFGITSIITAAAVSLFAEYWIRKSLFRWRFVLKSTSRSLRELAKSDWKRLAIAGLLVFIIVFQVFTNMRLTFGAQSASPVNADDISAFNWIRTQTPLNATFFVDLADGGSWIPIYADRRVIFPFGVVTNNSLLANYTAVLSSFESDPSSPQNLQFLRSFNVTYIYSGPARIYGRTGFDPYRMLAGPFREVYHQGDVWIFQM